MKLNLLSHIRKTNEWHHIALRRSKELLELFVDGGQKKSIDFDGDNSIDLDIKEPLLTKMLRKCFGLGGNWTIDFWIRPRLSFKDFTKA